MSILNRFTNRIHLYLWISSFIPICCFLATISIVFPKGGRVPSTDSFGSTLGAITRRMVPVPKCTIYRGVATGIAPAKMSLAVTVTIANHGHETVSVMRGGLGSWSFAILDGNGRPVAAEGHNHYIGPNGVRVRLAPGMSLSRTLNLSQYPALSGVGTFYIFAIRSVIAKGLASGWMTTPILKLILSKGAPPVWKAVSAIPHPMRGYHEAKVSIPSFPKYHVPATGPIATLSEIANAVHARDLSKVRQLCYKDHHASESFYVAFAQRAIAASRCIQSVQKRFGLNPWPHLIPSPNVFSHILRRLALQSLKIKGNKASVGILWYHDGKFVLFPSFTYHFRMIHSHWLLDSWATQSSAPRFSTRLYRLNVENNLKEAHIFNSMIRDLSADKFANIRDFMASATRQMAREGNWFMTQSLKGVGKSLVPNPKMARLSVLPQKYHGVVLVIAPDSKLLEVVASITNHGRQTVTLWNGGPFGWRLMASNAHGRGLGITQEQQKRWQTPHPGKRRINLQPGMSLHKVFHLRRYCVLPEQGNIYIYVSRFVTLGGVSSPIASPILRLTLKKGIRPLWKVVTAVPQPNLRVSRP